MYPNQLFFNLTLYDILICVGIIFCFIVFGFLADKRKIKVSLQKVALYAVALQSPWGFSLPLFFRLFTISQQKVALSFSSRSWMGK